MIGVLALAAGLALPPAAPVRIAPQQPEQPSTPAFDEPGEADPLPVESLQQLRFGVRTERLDGELWVSVRTQDAPLRPLLEELALQTGTVFSGLERIPATVRVTADLEHRSLRQVVTWILGSVGLRADRRLDTFTLHVDADTRADLLAQAGTEYLRTLREFPNHPLADRTLFGQGLLEEDKGQPAAARLHYEGLVEAYPESPLVDDALKRCAELFMEAEDWASAAQRWSELLRLEQQSSHQVEAYEQLALCTVLLGDADRTVHMLDALENIAPAESDLERQERLYVRARAQLGQRAYRQSLESLAQADAHGRTDRQKLISHELRARALSGLEEYGAASRSWLAFCELARGEELERGLRQAAETALAAGDELGMLFIERLAAKHGLAAAVEDAAREARARLDLVPTGLAEQAEVERLARAERLLQAGLDDEAQAVLEGLMPALERFGADERTRFVLSYGRALGSADAAVIFFRQRLGSLADPDDRRQVYLLAAELFEAEGRIDEAIEAYQGRL